MEERAEGGGGGAWRWAAEVGGAARGVKRSFGFLFRQERRKEDSGMEATGGLVLMRGAGK